MYEKTFDFQCQHQQQSNLLPDQLEMAKVIPIFNKDDADVQLPPSVSIAILLFCFVALRFFVFCFAFVFGQNTLFG